MKRPRTPPVAPFEAGELPPKKVAWLHPGQLVRTAYHVWLSTVAMEYLDRRESLAALDQARGPDLVLAEGPVTAGTTVDAFLSGPLDDGGVWIDYVADIGDSWEATYAIARMLVTPELRVRGYEPQLNVADILVLGGDLVYPTPSRDRYRRRMRSAFLAARPIAKGRERALFAIPGNHDWYDGLTNFVREFCQGQRLGGWSMCQRRSYFAVKLVPRWWLWGIDIALDTRIDAPQQAYFLKVLNNACAPDNERFQNGDNIILCTAKPAWLDDEDNSDAYRNLSYFVQEIVEKNDGPKGHVRVILAGDLHHYSRYESKRGNHMITAGGGGSYLTGTHHLPDSVPDLSPPAQEPGLAGAAAGDQPKSRNAYDASAFPYPSRSNSRRLALGALLLAFRYANWPFVLLIGTIYLFFIWTLLQFNRAVLDRSPTELMQLPFDIVLTPSATAVFFTMLAILVVCAIVPVASKRSARRWLAIPWGLSHGLVHLIVALIVASQIRASQHSGAFHTMTIALPYEQGATGTVLAVGVILLGGFTGATLVGIYFVLSDVLFGWHANEVFASQSIVDYRNFVKMHIAPNGKLMIFPIGLRKVPKKWRLRLNQQEDEPFYEPSDQVLDPHLIEGPLTIRPR
jgi:hypothetical protein